MLVKSALAAAACLALLVSLWQSWQRSRETRILRKAMLEHCEAAFQPAEMTIDLTGYPRLAGTYRGVPVSLRFEKDALNFRKLPVLWLLITIAAPVPVKGRFDMMMRPRGIEPFSGFSDLPVQVTPPHGFPEDCAIRIDAPGNLPDEHMLRRHLALFQDDRVKELVIAPAGLRLTWMAEEAHRTRYLIFRDSDMGSAAIPAATVTALLDKLIAIRDDLIAHAGETSP
ncbi:hypothetical protein [Aestuariivirga sp.]|uniref:hypothetical protein n=1 Tax=Aestuariivirga sp. TaxID=2650926 RepID=UPI0039E3C82F